MNDIPDFHVREKYADITSFVCPINSAARIIDTFVRLATSVIFEGIFDGCDSKNEYDRNHRHFFAERTDRRYPVKQHDEQEVEVGETVELLQKVLRNERERSVFRGTNGIVAVRPIRVVSGLCPRRDDVIWHNCSKTRQFWGFGLTPEQETIYQWDASLPDRVNRFCPRGLTRVAFREYFTRKGSRRLTMVTSAVCRRPSACTILMTGR